MSAEARIFALEVHKGQIDKAGEPYITHVFSVVTHAERIFAHLENMGLIGHEYLETVQNVAVLHDTIEDCGVTKEDLLKIVTEYEAHCVDVVSRRKTETYREFIQRIIDNGDIIPVIVKLADNMDNSDPVRLAILSEEEASIINRYNRAKEQLVAFLRKWIAERRKLLTILQTS